MSRSHLTHLELTFRRRHSAIDFLGADTILQSRDLSLVARSSPVLGGLIRDTSNSIIPGNADAPLLVVRLPESTQRDSYQPPQFYFSLFPYTASDIGHRRDDGAPFSSSEVRNEFRAGPHATLPRSTRPTFYPQRQRIPCIFPRSEVRIASRSSKSRATHLEVRLTFEDLDGKLEGKLDIIPGTYLHELWTFHDRFRICVNTDLQGFRKSSASSMVKGLGCTSSGIPSWPDYIISTAIYPFLRDFVEFQKAWVQHVKGSTGWAPARIVGAYRLRSSAPYEWI
ncbi:hypothetical protein EDB89DRAFT_1910421 [Lactarius sanguifluus]|nr:hypothetical protein EDB89DRAFT_1910421 [Lactarius sanguifluus]